MNSYGTATVECIKIPVHQAFGENFHDNVVKRWQKRGLRNVETETTTRTFANKAMTKVLCFKFSGSDEENESNCERILALLARANATRDFPLILEMLIPASVVGYVIGRNGDTIKQVKERFEVDAHIEGCAGVNSWKQPATPVPEGFSRLIIKAATVAKARETRDKFQQIVDNAFANMSNADAKILATCSSDNAEKPPPLKIDAAPEVEEKFLDRMRIPSAQYFSEEEMNEFEEIKRLSDVEFSLNSSDGDEHFRFLWLLGDPCKIFLVKKQLLEFLAKLQLEPESVRTLITSDNSNKSQQTQKFQQITQCHSSSVSEQQPTPITSTTLTSSTTKILHSDDKKLNQEKRAKNMKNDDEFSSKHQQQKQQKPFPSIKSFYKTSIIIPTIMQTSLIGTRGDTIKKLQKQFGVKMCLIGDNSLDYLNGRTLKIVGRTEESVRKARKFVEEEFILKEWETMNIGQRVFLPTDCGDEEEEEENKEQKIVYREVKVPTILTTQSEEPMAKMQKKSGIIEYLYRSPRPDGTRVVVLRGTREAVARAAQELQFLVAEIHKQKFSEGGNF